MASFHVVGAGMAVHIALSEHSIDENANILLSPDLMSDGEIDGYVEYLVKEIERTGKQAKEKLRKINEEIEKEGLFRQAK